MDLVHDLLDKEVVDRHGRIMGRADSVILDVRAGHAPRVLAIEIGPGALADRLHAGLGRWVRAMETRLGIDRGRPARIPIDAISFDAGRLRADLALRETGAGALEQRLRLLMRRVPWS
jgi:sporulation protein YlmC with PRC-barrel domain